MSDLTYKRNKVLSGLRAAIDDLESMWQPQDDRGTAAPAYVPSSHYSSYEPSSNADHRNFDASVVRARDGIGPVRLRKLIEEARRGYTASGRPVRIIGYVARDNMSVYDLRKMSGVDLSGNPVDRRGQRLVETMTTLYAGYPWGKWR